MKKKRRKTGLIVQPDDLNIGEWYTVLGMKNEMDAFPYAGMAFRITAMNLPFIVGRPAIDPPHPITIDSRYMNLMKVSDDYVMAQRQGEDNP